MSDDEIPPSRPRAAIFEHDKFTFVETRSGFRSAWSDPEGAKIYLSPAASAEDLGNALIAALGASRTFTVESRPIITREMHAERYQAWVADVMQRYGFKTRRAMFKPMKNVGAGVYHGQLHLSPSRHEKLEGWGRSKDDGIEDVIIPYPSAPETIGEAIRLALSRCM